MGRNDAVKMIAVFTLLFVFCLPVMMLTGCGKSADDLYIEGKALLYSEKSFDKGVELFLLFEKKFPNDPRTPEVMLALASGYHVREDFNNAEKNFFKLIEKYPSSAEAYKGMFLLGYMYYDNIKDTEKAKSIFNRFITMYPDSELTVSARVISENIELPIEEWSTVRNIVLPADNNDKD